METLAQKLRKAREDSNMTLKDINEQTKISLKMLEALEKGEFSHFESEVYITGALRHYAEAVGLDPQEIVELYRQLRDDKKEPEKEVEVPKKPVEGGREIRAFPLLMAAAVAIVLIGIFWGMWASRDNGFSLSFPGFRDIEENDVENRVNEDIYNDDINDEEEEEVDEEEEEVSLTRLEDENGTMVYELTGVEKMEFELEFTSACWFQITIGGEEYMMDTYHEGEDLQFEAEDEVRIRFGSSAVDMYVNEEKIRELEEHPVGVPSNFLFNLGD